MYVGCKMSNFHLVGEDEQWKIKRAARGLIDSEYEALQGFSSVDLWDYLSAALPGITRKSSDELYDDMLYMEED